MSDVVRDAQSHPGYYLPEHAQYRLQQLRDHMRFLARLAQPRTQAEEQARQPAIAWTSWRAAWSCWPSR